MGGRDRLVDPLAKLALEMTAPGAVGAARNIQQAVASPLQTLEPLCLKRREYWTPRETLVRLSEHTDWRPALRLPLTPD